jgi:hypothetical protein
MQPQLWQRLRYIPYYSHLKNRNRVGRKTAKDPAFVRPARGARRRCFRSGDPRTTLPFPRAGRPVRPAACRWRRRRRQQQQKGRQRFNLHGDADREAASSTAASREPAAPLPREPLPATAEMGAGRRPGSSPSRAGTRGRRPVRARRRRRPGPPACSAAAPAALVNSAF